MFKILIFVVVGIVLSATNPVESSYPFSFVSNEDKYECTAQIVANTAFTTCADGSPFMSQRINLKKGSELNEWKSYCGQKCIEQTSGNCVAVFRNNFDFCELIFCNPGVKIGSIIAVERVPHQAERVTAILQPACFDAIKPSLAPTLRPTTESPVPSCEVAGTFADDFSTLNSFSANINAFVQIVPDQSLCEYVELNGAIYDLVSNFDCTLASCLRWCYWDSACNYAMYSSVTQQCYRANLMTLTDSSENFQSFYTDQFVVYSRLLHVDGTPFPSPYGIPYYNSLCSQYPRHMCKTNPECGWDKGKQGYNDPLQGGNEGGWCGRIQCLAAEATPSDTPALSGRLLNRIR
jgi:hypothetical protein